MRYYKVARTTTTQLVTCVKADSQRGAMAAAETATDLTWAISKEREETETVGITPQEFADLQDFVESEQ